MIPHWLTILSLAMLALGAMCAAVITVDLIRGHRQHMWIMNLVWPLTALFGTVFTVWDYFRYGRLATHRRVMAAKAHGEEPPNRRLTPFAVMVANGASHCGSGCELGDVAAETIAFTLPAVTVWLGWKTLFPPTPMGKMYAVWVLDFILAFLFGIAFQFFTIRPMRHLSVAKGLWQALKADALSLTAWQVGMYGFMAFAQIAIFSRLWHQFATPDRPEFWFAMQLAMICGFLTSYPVNWWLIKKGIKEKM